MWTYRIIKKRSEPSGTEYYALVEMYYDKDGTPSSYVLHDEIVGESVQDIVSQLTRMIYDAQIEVEKNMVIDEKDFEEGGRYHQAGENWFKDITGDIDERLETGKSQTREEAKITLEKWFAEFEVENRTDYSKSIHHFITLLKEGGVTVGLSEVQIEKMAEESYKTWRGSDDEDGA